MIQVQYCGLLMAFAIVRYTVTCEKFFCLPRNIVQSSQAKFFLIGHLVDAIASFAQEHQSELISILSKEDHSGFFDPNKLIILDRMILVMHKGISGVPSMSML